MTPSSSLLRVALVAIVIVPALVYTIVHTSSIISRWKKSRVFGPHSDENLVRAPNGFGMYGVTLKPEYATQEHVRDLIDLLHDDGTQEEEQYQPYQVIREYTNGFELWLADDSVHVVAGHEWVDAMVMMEYPVAHHYHPHHINSGDSASKCGVPDNLEHSDVYTYHRVDHGALRSGEHTQTFALQFSCDPRDPCVMLQVPLVFHTATTGAPAASNIRSQVDLLNSVWNPYGLNFTIEATLDNVNAACEATCYTTNTQCSACRVNYSPVPDPKTAVHVYLYAFTDTTLGYSYLPDSWPEDNLNNGVVVRPSSLPDMGNAAFTGHTLSHELGHFLGLDHTFSGACAGVGDNVADTPPENGAHYNCPATQTQSCPGQSPWYKWNIMSYYDDVCMTGFTAGQGQRVNVQFPTYKPALYALAASNANSPSSSGGSQVRTVVAAIVALVVISVFVVALYMYQSRNRRLEHQQSPQQVQQQQQQHAGWATATIRQHAPPLIGTTGTTTAAAAAASTTTMTSNPNVVAQPYVSALPAPSMPASTATYAPYPWSEEVTEDGTPYYYNQVTQESVWECPY